MINTINRAIAKRREELAENEKGFTLIELLVVVLIIGILAAIAIPAFLSQREGGWETQVKSDLKNASLAAESYAAAHGGTFTNMTNGAKTDANSIKNYGFNPTSGVGVKIASAGTTYTLQAAQKDLTVSKGFKYDSATGKISPEAVTGITFE